MGRMLPTSERREKDFSTPLAGLERSKYETGPTSTGTVSMPSCMRCKIISLQALFFIKENSMPLPLQGENHKHIRKKALQGILSYCHYATLNEKIVLWRLCITVKMAKSVCSKIVHL